MTTPPFHNPDDPLGEGDTIGEFWRWAMSDLLGNRNRGILAEYLVAKALLGTLESPRIEWDCADLEYRGRKIEVKSSAYVQSWHAEGQVASPLRFGVGPHTCWDGRTNTTDSTRRRHAHYYIFCVFPNSGSRTDYNVRDTAHWDFYLTSTAHLEQHPQITPETDSIGLGLVKAICGEPIPYGLLQVAVIDPLHRNLHCETIN